MMGIAHLLLTLMLGSAPEAAPAKANAVATPARQRSGRITPDDYPMSALRERAEGRTTVRLRVGADGRVEDCVVDRSSGNPALDSNACSLSRRRFRYQPARNRKGAAVPDWQTHVVDWKLPHGIPLPSGSEPARD